MAKLALTLDQGRWKEVRTWRDGDGGEKKEGAGPGESSTLTVGPTWALTWKGQRQVKQAFELIWKNAFHNG